jgi:sirohydrochlorin cobaltochelatase
MGHGTHHAGNIYYPGLQDYISRRSNSVLVGTVEGAPTLEQVMSDLKAAQEKKVCLMPLMSVAGDHARNDMAGPEDESWKSRMRAEGFDTTSLLKGLGEDDRFVALWLDHLKNALHEVEHH